MSISRVQNLETLKEHAVEMQAWRFNPHEIEPHWDVVAHESGKAFALISRYLDDNSPAELELLLVLLRLGH